MALRSFNQYLLAKYSLTEYCRATCRKKQAYKQKKVKNLTVKNLTVKNLTVKNLTVKSLMVKYLTVKKLTLKNLMLKNLTVKNLMPKNLTVKNLTVKNLTVNNFKVKNSILYSLHIATILKTLHFSSYTQQQSGVEVVAFKSLEERSFNSHPYWPVKVRFPDTKMQFLHRQNASFSLLYYSPVCSFQLSQCDSD